MLYTRIYKVNYVYPTIQRTDKVYKYTHVYTFIYWYIPCMNKYFKKSKKMYIYQTRTDNLVHTKQLLRPLCYQYACISINSCSICIFFDLPAGFIRLAKTCCTPRCGPRPAAPSAAAQGLEPAMWRHTAALRKVPCPLQLEVQNDSDLGASPFFD